jgi:hypothetical protein
MAGIPCSAPKCQFSTDSQVPPATDLTTTLLQIHRETVHPTPVTPQAAPTPHSTPRVKLDPPKLSTGSDQETWELFLRSWGLHKSGMNIQDAQSSVYLFNCLATTLVTTSSGPIPAVKKIKIKNKIKAQFKNQP